MRRESVEEGVPGVVVRLAEGPHDRGEGGEEDEAVERPVPGRLVQVPRPEGLGIEGGREGGAVEFVEEAVFQHHGGVEDPAHRRQLRFDLRDRPSHRGRVGEEATSVERAGLKMLEARSGKRALTTPSSE